jgi:hypothetical protein
METRTRDKSPRSRSRSSSWNRTRRSTRHVKDLKKNQKNQKNRKLEIQLKDKAFISSKKSIYVSNLTIVPARPTERIQIQNLFVLRTPPDAPLNSNCYLIQYHNASAEKLPKNEELDLELCTFGTMQDELNFHGGNVAELSFQGEIFSYENIFEEN